MLSSLTDLNGAFVASPTDGMMAVATAEEAAAVVEAVRDYTSDSNSSVVTAVARGTGAMAATTVRRLAPSEEARTTAGCAGRDSCARWDTTSCRKAASLSLGQSSPCPS
jgi:hypothetical protein